MPNTLAHIGINGFLSKSVFKNSDLLWIYLGCIVPDIPWILKRVVDILLPGINGYDLIAYTIIQATLVSCLILSAALASISNNFRRTFIILGLGSILHLILDSLQIKWANGVLLFAPFNWELLNFGLFWPENYVSYILTILGLIFLILNLKHLRLIKNPLLFNLKNAISFIFLLALYFIVPFILFENVELNDISYLATLRNYEEREGKYVELDRKFIYFNSDTQSTWAKAYDDNLIELIGVDKLDCYKLSVRGTFISQDQIEVKDYHENWAGYRDGSSYLGLGIVFAFWIYSVFGINKRKNIE